MRVERRAGLEVTGRVHILRHTYCANLAMRGAPAKAIQELAGHADITTTMGYMHLTHTARAQARTSAMLDPCPVPRLKAENPPGWPCDNAATWAEARSATWI